MMTSGGGSPTPSLIAITKDPWYLKNVDGVIIPTGLMKTLNIRNAMNLYVEDGDIFVVGYPKCGSTWMVYLVWSLVNKGAYLPNINDMFSFFAPYVEMVGTEALRGLHSADCPRVIKLHLPCQRRPDPVPGNVAKYIYVARNPKDCLTSYYHSHKEIPGLDFAKDFDEFFRCFVMGLVGYGSYWDHVSSWYQLSLSDPKNVLFVTYEDMKADTAAVLQKVAEFLGEKYVEDLRENELLEKIVSMTTFDKMKHLKCSLKVPDYSNSSSSSSSSESTDQTIIKAVLGKRRHIIRHKIIEVDLLRKGQVGDWRNFLNEWQSAIIDAHTTDRFRDHGFLCRLWPSEVHCSEELLSETQHETAEGLS